MEATSIYLFRRNSFFEGAPTKVVLTNLSKRPESVWNLPVTAADDWVILSPRNYMVVPTGTSDSVNYGGDYLFGKVIYDSSLIMPGSRKPDITADDLTSNLSEQETDTRFFEVDTILDELTIGGGGSDEFGSAFFDADMSIGGDQDYGITFTLLSKGFGALGPNSASSVGGDFELSELMGYAGDSRLDAAGNTFVATNPDDRGLDPPKIAVEFDTRTNNAAGDPPPDYCSGADANADSRNDPLTGNKDAVQYVFWGRTSFLNIPCRDNNTLYDDNRHDADGEQPKEEWRFDTSANISLWRPAFGSDGTIYMSTRNGTLYALNEDGTEKWNFPLGDSSDYMPGIDTKGTPDPSDDVIYSDIQNNKIVAIDSGGNQLWQFDVASDIDSTPIVGPDGRVYFGTDAERSLFAIDPVARAAGQPFPDIPSGEWQRPTGGEVDGVAALSPDASVVYFVANAPDNNLYAVNTADGSIRWQFPFEAESGELNSSPAVNPADGTIYVGSDDHNVYAINPNGTQKWSFTTGADVESSPVVAIDPIDGNPTVYIGSDDNKVYALDAETGAKKWEFVTGDEVLSSPIVDLDGTIYVGSRDNNVYAINPNGIQKWIFPTGNNVRSSPAIGKAGFIHIGSNDTNFYTISQFGDPRNFKDEDQSLGKLLTSAELDSSVLVNSTTDWLNGAGSRGSWAVRLQVDRALLPNIDGEFDYELRLWIRQCSDQFDTPCDEILGTSYQDTRIEYDYTAVVDLPMRQSFSLSGPEQDAFNSFFFGFTGAAGAEALDVTISQFQLSFIRPGDTVVDCDKTNWPLEDSPPLPDCTITN
jgi:outer membrane protein assembly factor BamB